MSAIKLIPRSTGGVPLLSQCAPAPSATKAAPMRIYKVGDATVYELTDAPTTHLIEGIASTPTVNSHGYSLASKGCEFTLPVPVLSQHGHIDEKRTKASKRLSEMAIGHVFRVVKSDQSIVVRAHIDTTHEAGRHAWSLIEAGETLAFSGAGRDLHLRGVVDRKKFFDRWTFYETSVCRRGANPDCHFRIFADATGRRIDGTGVQKRASVQLSHVTKFVRGDKRILRGTATTNDIDLAGDIVEPRGAEYRLPLPLLAHHRHDRPIGHVIEAKMHARGIDVTCEVASGIADADSIWEQIEANLINGFSIGFLGVQGEPMQNGGTRWTKWRWIELSAVTIPCNDFARITATRAAHPGAIALTGSNA